MDTVVDAPVSGAGEKRPRPAAPAHSKLEEGQRRAADGEALAGTDGDADAAAVVDADAPGESVAVTAALGLALAAADGDALAGSDGDDDAAADAGVDDVGDAAALMQPQE